MPGRTSSNRYVPSLPLSVFCAGTPSEPTSDICSPALALLPVTVPYELESLFPFTSTEAPAITFTSDDVYATHACFSNLTVYVPGCMLSNLYAFVAPVVTLCTVAVPCIRDTVSPSLLLVPYTLPYRLTSVCPSTTYDPPAPTVIFPLS